MAALVEDILPPSFYSQTHLGVQVGYQCHSYFNFNIQADERVTRQLVKTHVNELSQTIDQYDVEVGILRSTIGRYLR